MFISYCSVVLASVMGAFAALSLCGATPSYHQEFYAAIDKFKLTCTEITVKIPLNRDKLMVKIL